jgi:hypothetical protein
MLCRLYLVKVRLAICQSGLFVVSVSKEGFLALCAGKVLDVPVPAQGGDRAVLDGPPARPADRNAHLVVAAKTVELVLKIKADKSLVQRLFVKEILLLNHRARGFVRLRSTPFRYLDGLLTLKLLLPARKGRQSRINRFCRFVRLQSTHFRY